MTAPPDFAANVTAGLAEALRLTRHDHAFEIVPGNLNGRGGNTRTRESLRLVSRPDDADPPHADPLSKEDPLLLGSIHLGRDIARTGKGGFHNPQARRQTAP